MSVHVYRLLLEYNGLRFAGWQNQTGRRTVQGELEKAFRRLFRKKISAVGASRTDAGVHASGQVVSFRAAFLFKGDLSAALNQILPSDMVVLSAQETNVSFHARKSACGKTYRYRLLNRPARPSRLHDDCGWVARTLDIAKMKSAARRLIGRHDFSRFAGRSTGEHGIDPVCHLKKLSIRREGECVVCELTADRFLNRMVRRIVGALVNAGLGLEREFPRTMAARGLILSRVEYDKRFDKCLEPRLYSRHT